MFNTDSKEIDICSRSASEPLPILFLMEKRVSVLHLPVPRHPKARIFQSKDVPDKNTQCLAIPHASASAFLHHLTQKALCRGFPISHLPFS